MNSTSDSQFADADEDNNNNAGDEEEERTGARLPETATAAVDGSKIGVPGFQATSTAGRYGIFPAYQRAAEAAASSDRRNHVAVTRKRTKKVGKARAKKRSKQAKAKATVSVPSAPPPPVTLGHGHPHRPLPYGEQPLPPAAAATGAAVPPGIAGIGAATATEANARPQSRYMNAYEGPPPVPQPHMAAAAPPYGPPHPHPHPHPPGPHQPPPVSRFGRGRRSPGGQQLPPPHARPPHAPRPHAAQPPMAVQIVSGPPGVPGGYGGVVWQQRQQSMGSIGGYDAPASTGAASSTSSSASSDAARRREHQRLAKEQRVRDRERDARRLRARREGDATGAAQAAPSRYPHAAAGRASAAAAGAGAGVGPPRLLHSTAGTGGASTHWQKGSRKDMDRNEAPMTAAAPPGTEPLTAEQQRQLYQQPPYTLQQAVMAVERDEAVIAAAARVQRARQRERDLQDQYTMERDRIDQLNYEMMVQDQRTMSARLDRNSVRDRLLLQVQRDWEKRDREYREVHQQEQRISHEQKVREAQERERERQRESIRIAHEERARDRELKDILDRQKLLEKGEMERKKLRHQAPYNEYGDNDNDNDNLSDEDDIDMQDEDMIHEEEEQEMIVDNDEHYVDEDEDEVEARANANTNAHTRAEADTKAEAKKSQSYPSSCVQASPIRVQKQNQKHRAATREGQQRAKTGAAGTKTGASAAGTGKASSAFRFQPLGGWGAGGRKSTSTSTSSRPTPSDSGEENKRAPPPPPPEQQQQEKQNDHGPRRVHMGRIVPTYLEEMVSRASALVAAEVRSGSWVCSSSGGKDDGNTAKGDNLGAGGVDRADNDSDVDKADEAGQTADGEGGKKRDDAMTDLKSTSDAAARTTVPSPPTGGKDHPTDQIDAGATGHRTKRNDDLLRAGAASIEKFANEMILPSLIAAGVAEAGCRDTIRGDDAGDDNDNVDGQGSNVRVLVATLLALREVLMMNANAFFFNPGDTEQRVQSSEQQARGASDGVSGSGGRKRLRDELEERNLRTKLLATGVVIAASRRLDVGAAVEEELLNALNKYDAADEEFSMCLERADGRSLCVLPNGKKFGREENVAWRVSFNRVREDHPLIRLRRERETCCRLASYGNGVASEETGNLVSHVLEAREHRVEIPSPNACAVYFVEKT